MTRRSAAPAAAAALLLCAAGASPAAALPGTSSAKDRAAWRALLRWPASCEKDWRGGHPDTAGIQVWRAGEGRRLVAVSCLVGAYQGTSVLYLLDRAGRPGAALRLHLYRDPGTGRPTPTRTTRPLGTLSFTTRTRTLWIVDRFRGVGDCGISSKLRLQGTRFVPTVTRAKVACDGKPPYDPERWPKLPTLGV